MRRFLPIFGLALIAGAACLHRLPHATSALRQELEEAKASCAEVYAPEAFSKAAGLVDQAEATAGTWHKLRARRLAREARAAIETARAESREKQEAARLVAAKAIEAVSAEIARAEEEGAGKEAAAELNRAKAGLADAQRLSRRRAAEEEAARRKRAEEKRAEEETARRKRAEEITARRRDRWTVTRGECLWLIASQPNIFGDPFKWPLIYWVNRWQIGDPDLIFPGQNFRIPRDSSPEEVEKAIHTARQRVWPTPNYLFDGQ
ncbi:MAG: hypothetical protein DMF49_05545 [Acidobacteria bacterium]|nr:MAG: hypothetical protein DMF49_05545 [Acidobacteriota bacterium]